MPVPHASGPGSARRRARGRPAVLRVGLAKLALTVIGAAALWPAPAGAQTTYVSNTEQAAATGFSLTSGSSVAFFAQGFETGAMGDANDKYALGSVQVYLDNYDGDDLVRVDIYSATTSDTPDTSLYQLVNPSTVTNEAFNTFTAPHNATLDEETTYFVVVRAVAHSPFGFTVSDTASEDEDPTPASGWSIANNGGWFFEGFPPDFFFANLNPMRMAIRGPAITNNTPQVSNPIPDQTATVGDFWSLQFHDTTFTDPDGDPLSYSATQADGSPLPGWLTFDDATRFFRGQPWVDDLGTVSVKVTAEDGNGGTVSDTFDIVVSPNLGNHPVRLVRPIPDMTATVGTPFSFQFAENTFSDVDGDPLTYRARQAYSATPGYDPALPEWLTFTASDRTFAGTPRDGDVGTLSIQLSADDRKGGAVSEEFDIVILPTAPGVPISFTAAPRDDGEVRLSWAAPASNGGVPIARYQYRHVPGTAVPSNATWTDVPDSPDLGSDAGDETGYTVDSLTNGVQYAFELRAVNAADLQGPAARDVATPYVHPEAPCRPRHLRALSEYDREVLITWSAPACDGGSPITHYEYRHAEGHWVPDDTPWTRSNLPPARDGNFAGASDLRNGQLHTFEVRAVAGGPGRVARLTVTPTRLIDNPENKPKPKAAANLPSAPRNLRVTFSDPYRNPSGGGSVDATLRWDPSSDSGNVDGNYQYRVFESGSTAVNWTDKGELLDATRVGLKTSTAYTFEVRRTNRVGSSPATARQATTPAYAVPGEPTVSLFVQGAARAAAPLTVGAFRQGKTDDAILVIIQVTDSAFPGKYRHVVIDMPSGSSSATATFTPAPGGGSGRTLSLRISHVPKPYGPGGTTELSGVRVSPAAVVSIADATARERSGATLAFAVTLNATLGHEVRVRYRTADGTANARDTNGLAGDYRALDGTLRIPAGTRSASIRIPVYDDDHDEGAETMTVRLFNPVGAVLASKFVATGTIQNTDPMPKAWLARFGRAASDNAVEAIARRWEGGPARTRETHFTVGGQRVDTLFERLTGARERPEPDAESDLKDRAPSRAAPAPLLAGTGPQHVHPGQRAPGAPPPPAAPPAPGAPPQDGTHGHAPVGAAPSAETWSEVLDTFAAAAGEARWARLYRQGRSLLDGARRLELRDVLMNSSFHYTPAQAASDGSAPPQGGWLGDWSAWGETATTRFSGADGPLALDGEVATALLGFDSRRGPWLAGVALSYTEGAGAYTGQRGGGGSVASALTSLHPYAHYRFSERISAWGVLGYGAGDLALTPRDARPIETDLAHAHAALGARAALAVRSGDAGRFELALRSDARLTDTASGAVVGLAGADGATSRVRLMLEGTGSLSLASGAVLTPTLEAGLRYDGGDAETGAGLELGAGIAYATGPFEIRVNARGLAAHQDEAYEEWGFSGSIVYRPASDGRGLSMNLGSSWGATESGVQSLWTRTDASGFAGGAAPWQPGRRLQAELGYGLRGRAGQALWTPYLGAERGAGAGEFRLGFRLAAGPNIRTELQIRFDERTRHGIAAAPPDISTRRDTAGYTDPSLTFDWSLRW